jgi:hypothetical protein
MQARRFRFIALLAAVLWSCASPAGPGGPERALYPSRLRLHELDPASVAPSLWLESRARIQRQAVTPRRHDVIVVPFQVQGYAIDAVERSLMTWTLADALEREGMRVANPELVERMLGGPQARHRASPDDLNAFFELAILLRVDRVVIGHAGHLLDAKLRVTVQSWELGWSGFDDVPSSVWERDALPLSDTELPSQVFRAHLDEVVASVRGESPIPKAPSSSAEGAADPGFPDSPEALVASPARSPLEAAQELQLLASAHPPGRGRERHFERSLVALAHAAPDAPHRALLEARAWWHLQRRPAALAALAAAPPGPEAAALRELLDGNLEGSGRGLDTIRSPLLRWHARLEHRFLQRAYGDRAIELTERALLAEAPAHWRPFVLLLLGASDAELVAELWKRLGASFPVADFGPGGQLAEDALLGRPFADERSLRLAPRRHVDRLLKVERDTPLQAAEYWRPHRADLLELLVGAAEQATFAHLGGLVAAADSRALEQIEDYAGVYAEDPRLEAVRFAWLQRSAARSTPAERAQRELRARALAERIQIWEGGQSAITTRLPHSGLYDADFPTRPDWFWPFQTPELVGMQDRHGQVDGLWSMESHLAHTTASVASLVQLHQRLLDAGQPQAAAELAKRSAGRFHGHPQRPRFLGGEPDASDPVAAAAHAVAQGTRAWSAYRLAAQPLLERGALAEAAAVYHRFPFFARPRPPAGAGDEVALQAWEAGSELFWRGDAALAAPFFEIAATAAPRSSAGLGSLFRLQLIDGRWGEAAQTARVRTATTSSAYAIRDFVMILHLLGAGPEAWALFERASLEIEDPELWSAAVVGQRIEGRTDADIADWLVDPKRARTQPMLRHLLLVALLQDRAPSRAWPRLVRRIHEAVVWSMPDVREVRLTPGELAELIDDSAAPDLAVIEFAAAWKRGRFDEAWKQLRRGEIDLRLRTSLIPYASWAATVAGSEPVFDADLAEAAKGWDELRRHGQLDERGVAMDLALAQAVRSGLHGEHDRALAALEAARNARAYTKGRLFLTWYQLVEICEALHRATGHEPYRALALDWARRHVRIQPMHGFAWALLARHSGSEAERREALRAALYLDRRSAMLEGVAPGELAEAQRWLAGHTPFPAAGAREPDRTAWDRLPGSRLPASMLAAWRLAKR